MHERGVVQRIGIVTVNPPEHGQHDPEIAGVLHALVVPIRLEPHEVTPIDLGDVRLGNLIALGSHTHWPPLSPQLLLGRSVHSRLTTARHRRSPPYPESKREQRSPLGSSCNR